jgi:hypothetical protein
MPRSSAGAIEAGPLPDPAAAGADLRAGARPRPRLGASRRRGRAGALRAGRPRPTRSIFSIPRARPGSPRASCATMAAIWWRWPGRCACLRRPGPGETMFWAASDIGWVVGHSYIVYAPLIAGCTTVLYEGKPVGTPDAGAFWRVIETTRSTPCSPRRPRSGRSARGSRRQLLASARYLGVKALFLAGERCDPADAGNGARTS